MHTKLGVCKRQSSLVIICIVWTYWSADVIIFAMNTAGIAYQALIYAWEERHSRLFVATVAALLLLQLLLLLLLCRHDVVILIGDSKRLLLCLIGGIVLLLLPSV